MKVMKSSLTKDKYSASDKSNDKSVASKKGQSGVSNTLVVNSMIPASQNGATSQSGVPMSDKRHDDAAKK